MKYLLDTDHISFLQRRSGSEFRCLTTRISENPATDFALSVVSFHEQVLGAHSLINRSSKKSDLIRGYDFLLDVFRGFSMAPVLPFDSESLAIFDDLRSQKVRVSTMDLRIASIAISHDLLLLTRNAHDFRKVPGLAIEDWTV